LDENDIRAGWKTGDRCRIYSKSKKKWFRGEVSIIFTDEEGEWLEIRYDKSMSKQVQRYSADIKPDPDYIRKRSGNASRSTKKSEHVSYADQEMKITSNDTMSEFKVSPKPKKDIASMRPQQVREFIRSLGSAYKRYAKNLKIRGSQLIMFDEGLLQNFVSHKLHRHRILMEIARNTPNRTDSHLFDHDIDVLHWDSSRVREWCRGHQITKLYADKFHNHGVDGMLLFELDEEDLDTIRVKKLHQRRVLEIIANFASDIFEDDELMHCEENGPMMISEANGPMMHCAANGPLVMNHEAKYGSMTVTLEGIHKNDAIIATMGQLLLEIGQMFEVGDVPELIPILKRQLDEMQME